MELGIELLEQGRAILFSGLAKLRLPLDELEEVASGLAKEFRSVNGEIEDMMSGKGPKKSTTRPANEDESARYVDNCGGRSFTN